MLKKNQFLATALLAGTFMFTFTADAQVKILKGVRDNMMDDANKDIALAKHEIDKVMQHPDTRDMCATWAWNGYVYADLANSRDSVLMALDKDGKAALIAGESFLRFYGCSPEEQEKIDAKSAAKLGVVNAIFACWNSGVYASTQKNNYKNVKSHMDMVVKLMPYDVDEMAKKERVTMEQALYMTWRTAYVDTLVSEEVIYLEKLMAIPTYMNSDIFVRMAQILSAEKKYEQALQYLEKGKEKIPQKAGDFLDMQINIEIERENMVALLTKFNEAIDASPDNAQYYFSRGVAFHKLKEDELKEQEAAIKSSGKSNPSKYHFIQGLNDYRKAIELDPGYFGASKNEAILMFDSANYIYKLRTKVSSADYERYNQLSINLYKQALEKFERLKESGALKDEELVDALQDMKTIAIKIGNDEKKQLFDAWLKTEKKKLAEKAETGQ